MTMVIFTLLFKIHKKGLPTIPQVLNWHLSIQWPKGRAPLGPGGPCRAQGKSPSMAQGNALQRPRASPRPKGWAPPGPKGKGGPLAGGNQGGGGYQPRGTYADALPHTRPTGPPEEEKTSASRYLR